MVQYKGSRSLSQMTSLCQGMHLTQTKETNTGDEKTGDERYNYQNDPENP